MDPTNAFREQIGNRLTLRLAEAVKNGEVSLEELPAISTYILENIDKATTNAQVMDFLDSISNQWPIFADAVNGEKAEAVKKQDNQKVEEISGLIQENKIDEALNVAHNATDTNTKGDS